MLIVAGVMMAGHHRTNSDGQDAGAGSGGGQIGMAEPPSPPPILASAPTATSKPTAGPAEKPNKVSTTGTPNSEPSHTKPGSPPNNSRQNQLGNGGEGLSASASAAGEYRKWRESQRYHFLESQIKADYAAYGAPLSAGGGSSQAGMPGGAADQTMRQLAQTQMSMLHKIGSQGNSAASGTSSAGGLGSTGYGRGNGGSQGNESWARKQGKSDAAYLNAKLRNPASHHEIFAGSVIPAVLVSGINSDLPGQITAQVRQNVYNSLNSSQVLIPQGARLVGVYDSGVAYGQSRVMVAWTRLILPNGQTLALGGMSGADAAGLAGFHDQVNNHYWRIFGSAFLISLLGTGAQLSQPQNDSNSNTTPTATQQAIAAMAQEWNNVGSQLLQKNLNIKPTLIIRPGYEFNVFVRKTIVMPVWQGGGN
jgi:type IV secretory pathway VirB10-like protein